VVDDGEHAAVVVAADIDREALYSTVKNGVFNDNNEPWSGPGPPWLQRDEPALLLTMLCADARSSRPACGQGRR
jgi:hypothetical protein